MTLVASKNLKKGDRWVDGFGRTNIVYKVIRKRTGFTYIYSYRKTPAQLDFVKVPHEHMLERRDDI